MAYERNPNDPYQRDLAENDARRAAQLDQELQPDPELAEGPANNGRVAIFAVAIAIVLGVVFYGLNNSANETNTASAPPAPATQNTAQNNASKPPVAPGVRDVTPTNTQPGVTTGAAPAPKPAQPPAAVQPQSNSPAPGAAK